MQAIDVNKRDLIERIRANRDLHRKIFDEAVEGYRVEAVRLLEEHIERISSGKVAAVFVSLPKPEDHTPDYDRVLRMLEWDIAETIKLPEQDFKQYVMDDWSWKREFITTAMTYNAASAGVTSGLED